MDSALSRTQEHAPRVHSSEITTSAWRVPIARYFYVFMSLLIAAVVVYGFSHTVDKKLIHPVIRPPFVVYPHAVVCSGWVVLFFLQTVLVAKGNVRWHRSMGRFGAVLGTVVVVLGVWTAISMERFNMVQLHRSGAPMILLVAFNDLIGFAVPFALAVYWRNKPEFHRRLMFIATCGLSAVAFSRMPILLWVPTRVFVSVGVDVLIFLGMMRDLIVSRSLHRVYLYTFPAFVICQITVAYTYQSPYWIKIAHAILD